MLRRTAEIVLGLGKFPAILLAQVLLLGWLLNVVMRLADDVLLAADESGHLIQALIGLAVLPTRQFQDVLAKRANFHEVDFRAVAVVLFGAGLGVIRNHVPIRESQ